MIQPDTPYTEENAMTLKHTIRSALFIILIFTIPVIAADDPFADFHLFDDKTYQDGFNHGISYAIAALVYKTYGNAVTPYSVERPIYYDDRDKAYQTKEAIHECVRDYITRDLVKAGGGVNMIYTNITNIVKRVLAYCGAERTQAP